MQLRRAALLALACTTLCASARLAHAGPFGVGAMAGEPIGVTAQLRLPAPHLGSAINLAAGLQLLEDNDLYAHADYIVLLTELVRTPTTALTLYAGAGAFYRDTTGARLGARIPVGLQLDLPASHLQLFVEGALRVSIVDDFGAGVGGAVGVRYFF